MIKEIVAQFAQHTSKGVEINLKALAKNEEFRQEVIKAVLKRVAESPKACVVIPSYQPGAPENQLGKLINELALNLQVKALVTGDVANIKGLSIRPEEVIIIKQSFRVGKRLQDQIEDLKAMGVKKVKVLCFIAHNSGRMQGYGHENDVEIDALVKIDEIRYLE